MPVSRRKERFERIVLAYVRALGLRLPENPNHLPPAIFAAVPGTTAEEVRAALRWSLQRSERREAAIERAMRKAELPHD